MKIDNPVYKADVDINANICARNHLGQCTVESTTTLDDRSFNVRDIAMPLIYRKTDLPTISYDASANTNPEGDSNGTIISINRP